MPARTGHKPVSTGTGACLLPRLAHRRGDSRTVSTGTGACLLPRLAHGCGDRRIYEALSGQQRGQAREGNNEDSHICRGESKNKDRHALKSTSIQCVRSYRGSYRDRHIWRLAGTNKVVLSTGTCTCLLPRLAHRCGDRRIYEELSGQQRGQALEGNNEDSHIFRGGLHAQQHLGAIRSN